MTEIFNPQKAHRLSMQAEAARKILEARVNELQAQVILARDPTQLRAYREAVDLAHEAYLDRMIEGMEYVSAYYPSKD